MATLSQAEIDSGRAWAAGKSYAEIAQGASGLGYSADQVAQVLGVTSDAVRETGYGTSSGLNSAVANVQWQPQSPASASPAAQGAYDSVPSTAAPAPSVSGGGMLYSTPTLPSNWGSYGAKQKIDYYNVNNITTSQLKAAGVSDADLGWMSQNGYTAGTSPAAAGVERGVTSLGVVPDNDFAKMLYAGGVNDAVATKRGIQYAQSKGWTPEQAVAQWNAALGANATVDDYNLAVRNSGMFGAGSMAQAGAQLTPEQMAAIKAAYGGNSADIVNPYVLQYAKEQGWSQAQTLAAINQTMGSNLGANDFAEGVNYYGFNWQDPLVVQPAAVASGVGGSRFNPNLDRAIDAANETVEGRLGNLLKTDERGNFTNPVVRQSVDRAMQQMAGRGLLNSSMASQAAQEAAIAKAIEIVGPDAERYFQQGRANQDAQNVFARDEVNFGYDLQKMSYASQLDMMKLNAQLDLDREKLTMSGSQFNQELKYKYDSLNLSSADRAAADARAQKNALEINSITSVNSAYDLYLRRISDIDNNPEYSAEAKVQMKNQAGKDFDIYARAKGIALEMDLGNRFSVSSTATAPSSTSAESAAGMLAIQSDYGQGGA